MVELSGFAIVSVVDFMRSSPSLVLHYVDVCGYTH